MRSMLTVISVVALLAVGASAAAAARPDPSPPARVDAAQHAMAMRSQGLQQRLHAQDLTVGTTPVRVVRAPATHDGFGWVDAAIGAGFAAALLLLVAGGMSVRRHPRMATR